MLAGRIKKIRTFQDPSLDNQIMQIIQGLDCWLGIQDADPDTASWGTGDFFVWVNNANPAAKVIKYWDGAAVQTV